MVVVNTHQRLLEAPPAAVGRLLDSLAGPDDSLWPAGRWPAMRLDRQLGVGAQGGHGPIRYRVESYEPSSALRFRFERPEGFVGHHEYVITPTSTGTLLRHALVMRTRGAARLTWPFVFRPLHDALVEDSLDRASASLGLPLTEPRRWNRRVRLLRAIAGAEVVRGGLWHGPRKSFSGAPPEASRRRPRVDGDQARGSLG